MTALATAFADLLIRAMTGLVSFALGGWSSSRPSSHGSSRWASWREHQRLGRVSTPHRATGDGIVLGFFGHHLLQSPPKNKVLLLGCQRAEKPSPGVVPPLLTWWGAAVATSPKEELVRLTA